MSEATYNGKTAREWCEWLIATCLHFGTTLQTAYAVAGHWAEGIERDWQPDGEPSQ